MCEIGYQDIDDDPINCEKGRKITDTEKKIALHHLQLLLLLACTACTGANRECKDGDCVCEIGYQDIDDDGDCEKGRKITDIKKLHYIILNCFYF